MYEKIIQRDFKILLVSTSIKWSSIERKVLADAIYLRNIGSSVELVCLRGSQLLLEAEKEDINCFPISKNTNRKIFNFRDAFELKKILISTNVDIVHCYSIKALWGLCHLLRRDIETSLYFTFNQNLENIYKSLLRKMFFKRVDNIFTFSEEVEDLALDIFPIASKKIKSLGGGLDLLVNQQEKKEVNSIGCIVHNVFELNRLKIFLKVFRLLKSRNNIEYEHIVLVIFLGPQIYQNEKAKKVLKEMDYEFYKNDISLVSLDSKKEELKKIDLLLSASFDEPINDYELMAILNMIPVLFPRTAARQSILFKYKWSGESYMDGDIREARAKLEKLINNFSVYRNALSDYHKELEERHGIDAYSEELLKSYHRNYAKRKRFSMIKQNRA